MNANQMENTFHDMCLPVLDHGYVRYVDHMGSDVRIVEAARISYKSGSKGEEQDRKLLAYLLKNKHTSPFEMCKISFNMKMPIFVMRQWVRHRMQNLNEVSARYTELPNEFYIPTKWRRQDTKNKQGSTDEGDWDKDIVAYGKTQNQIFTDLASAQCGYAYEMYQRLLRDGVAREMARMVLPVNIYTEIFCCWDLNNLLKFFALRDDAHAQSEIQEYARAMKKMTALLFPWVMELYEETRKGGLTPS